MSGRKVMLITKAANTPTAAVMANSCTGPRSLTSRDSKPKTVVMLVKKQGLRRRTMLFFTAATYWSPCCR